VKTKVRFVAILFLASCALSACNDEDTAGNAFRRAQPQMPASPIRAPEIDPGSGMTAITLLAGVLYLLVRRRA
jgi:predicted small secreted protein